MFRKTKLLSTTQFTVKPDEVTTEDAEGRNIFAVFTCSSHIISFPFCNVTVVMNIVALLLYALNDL